MRTIEECALFEGQLLFSTDNKLEARYHALCYEACIPKMFWDGTSESITFNIPVFDGVVRKYAKEYKKVLKNGYGLLFCGDNGTGKTTFMSWILTQHIRRGLTAYYTTLPQLDMDIKRGFNDPSAERRLSELLESDFIAIDEFGKEFYRKDSYLSTRIEALLKQRYDDEQPVLIGTNVDSDALRGMYGATVESMLDGKYQRVSLEPGDLRRSKAEDMRSDMGYE